MSTVASAQDKNNLITDVMNAVVNKDKAALNQYLMEHSSILIGEKLFTIPRLSCKGTLLQWLMKKDKQIDMELFLFLLAHPSYQSLQYWYVDAQITINCLLREKPHHLALQIAKTIITMKYSATHSYEYNLSDILALTIPSDASLLLSPEEKAYAQALLKNYLYTLYEQHKSFLYKNDSVDDISFEYENNNIIIKNDVIPVIRLRHLNSEDDMDNLFQQDKDSFFKAVTLNTYTRKPLHRNGNNSIFRSYTQTMFTQDEIFETDINQAKVLRIAKKVRSSHSIMEKDLIKYFQGKKETRSGVYFLLNQAGLDAEVLPYMDKDLSRFVDGYDFSVEENKKEYQKLIDIIMVKMFCFLASLHENDLIHGDIKLKNICFDNKTKRIVFIDFDGLLTKGSKKESFVTHEYLTSLSLTDLRVGEKSEQLDIGAAAITILKLILAAKGGKISKIKEESIEDYIERRQQQFSMLSQDSPLNNFLFQISQGYKRWNALSILAKLFDLDPNLRDYAFNLLAEEQEMEFDHSCDNAYLAACLAEKDIQAVRKIKYIPSLSDESGEEESGCFSTFFKTHEEKDRQPKLSRQESIAQSCTIL